MRGWKQCCKYCLSTSEQELKTFIQGSTQNLEYPVDAIFPSLIVHLKLDGEWLPAWQYARHVKRLSSRYKVIENQFYIFFYMNIVHVARVFKEKSFISATEIMWKIWAETLWVFMIVNCPDIYFDRFQGSLFIFVREIQSYQLIISYRFRAEYWSLLSIKLWILI